MSSVRAYEDILERAGWSHTVEVGTQPTEATSSDGFLKGTLQQILHAQPGSHVAHIRQVQALALHLEHAQHVAPLAVRAERESRRSGSNPRGWRNKLAELMER